MSIQVKKVEKLVGVKLCIIADTHREHRELEIPACDILIHAGDMGKFSKDAEVLKDIDQWFGECSAKHVVCIGGNHDFLLEGKKVNFNNAILLEDELIELEGLKIYGSPWCPELVNFAFYQNNTGLKDKWSKIPDGVDVLVTHTPPYGILDIPTAGTPHLGCPYLLHELERVTPQLHVFGHIHASYGRTVRGETEFVNASAVKGRDYVVSNAAVEVEL